MSQLSVARSVPGWLPHAATFAMFVIVAEIYVGVAMILGLTPRLASVIALFLLVNY